MYRDKNSHGSALIKFKPPTAGVYRFRISTYTYRSPAKPVIMSAWVGNFGELGVGGGSSQLAGYHEIPPGEPTIVEIVARIMHPATRSSSIRLILRGYVSEILRESMPLESVPGDRMGRGGRPAARQWPPPSHRRLFGDLDLTQGTLADAEQVLRRFLPRAFRRSISDDDVQPYLKLVGTALKEGQPFEQAMRAGLKMALCSPRFLFLTERPGKLDDFALASRLSYFLWSSMPDEELLAAARRGGLSQPDVLRGQVERLLKSPRAAAFTENFPGQWLSLRQINFTTPDKQLYPEFDELLEWSMVRETQLFFEELLRHDLSLLNFVDSDFTMLNERLARHYGIPGVEGLTFRKVPLRPEHQRGGVLTQASVLKVTANGTTTSPVLRGVWVLDRILGKPPAAARRRAGGRARHPRRDHDSRAVGQASASRHLCSVPQAHRPAGFALENYDAIGGWRERYRTLGTGKRLDKVVDGDRVAYGEGSAVDAGDILADGRKFADLAGLKKLLLADPDQITRALTEKLVVYATGHRLEYGDRDAVEQIVARTRSRSMACARYPCRGAKRTLLEQVN